MAPRLEGTTSCPSRMTSSRPLTPYNVDYYLVSSSNEPTNILFCTHEFCAHSTNQSAIQGHRRVVSTQPITTAHISVASKLLEDCSNSESGDLTVFVELAPDRIVCCVINHELRTIAWAVGQSSEPFGRVVRSNEDRVSTRLQACLGTHESSASNKGPYQNNIIGLFQNLALQDHVMGPQLLNGAQSFGSEEHTVIQVTEPNEELMSRKLIATQTSSILQKLDPVGISNNLISALSVSGPLDPPLPPLSSLGDVTEVIDDSLANLCMSGCRVVSGQFNLRKLDLAPVAEGGHGLVYRGELDGNEVAIKHPKITVSQTFDQKRQLVQNAAYEALIWWLCDHPNIQKLTAVARFGGQLAMISSWARHGDLSRIITRPDLSFRDRFVLSTQVCDSVVYLHSLDIFHGDIKSSNILLSDDGTPKLTDFGSAVKKGLPAPVRDLIASRRWMPSEIWKGGEPTPQSDVYSLAMTIFEIFTGSVPYAGIHGPAIVGRIARGVHPERPENLLPSGDEKCDLLWTLLVKCWAFDPFVRPAAAEVRYQLNSIAFD